MLSALKFDGKWVFWASRGVTVRARYARREQKKPRATRAEAKKSRAATRADQALSELNAPPQPAPDPDLSPRAFEIMSSVSFGVCTLLDDFSCGIRTHFPHRLISDSVIGAALPLAVHMARSVNNS